MRMYVATSLNGLSVLCSGKPPKVKIGRTERWDWYVPYGDMIGNRHMCKEFIEMIWEFTPEPGHLYLVSTMKGHLIKEVEE